MNIEEAYTKIYSEFYITQSSSRISKKHNKNKVKQESVFTFKQEDFISIFKEQDVAINVHIKPKNFSGIVHKHDFYEMVYVLDGKCKNVVGGNCTDLQKHDICLMNPLAEHDIILGAEECKIFNILIRKSFVDQIVNSLCYGNDILSNFFLINWRRNSRQQNYIKFIYDPLDTRLLEDVHKLILECTDDDIFKSKMINAIANSMFVNMTRKYKQDFKLMNQDFEEQVNVIPDMLDYIRLNCHTVTIKSVAKKYSYHYKYLPNLIKKYTGQSFSSILTHYRMQNVMDLLLSTDLTISEICDITGYHNKTNFYKVFKIKTGTTPNDFRKSSKDKSS